MIKNINYLPNQLTFINSKGNQIIIEPYKNGYLSIYSFLEVEDGVICIFDLHKEKIAPELRRRNVIKFDENGDLKWIVDDFLRIWEKKFKNDSGKIDKIKNSSFSNLFFNEAGSLILRDSNGPEYLLNPNTGEITYWRTMK